MINIRSFPDEIKISPPIVFSDCFVNIHCSFLCLRMSSIDSGPQLKSRSIMDR